MFLFVSFFFYLPHEDVVLWMNVFQNKLCITVCLTTRLECLERNGTRLTIRNMPVIWGQRSDSGKRMACTEPTVSGWCSSRTFTSPGDCLPTSWWNCFPSCYVRSWYRTIESQGSAVCSSLFLFFERYLFPPSPNTLVLGSKYVMFCIKCLFTWIGRDWGSERRTSWYLICRKEKIPALNAFHSLFWLEYIFVKKKTKTKNKHGEDISTNSNAIQECGKEWQPAAFSATQRETEGIRVDLFHPHQRDGVFCILWAAIPTALLQHYQMKESPIAFEKKCSFWMFDFKNPLCLFEKISVWRNRTFSRLSIISSKTPFPAEGWGI